MVVVGAAVGVFLVTNVDDLVLLTALFASPGARWTQVVAGQYLGVGALLALSVGAAAGLVVVPGRWVGLLGVVPLGLGVRGLLEGGEAERPVRRVTVRTVATLTVAAGADNVSVYVPVFRRVGPGPTLVYVLVFAVATGVWTAVASFVATRRVVVDAVERWGSVLIPLVFVAIGVALVTSAVVG